MKMTHHASVRCQQRAIPPILLDLLMQFGKCAPAGDGTSKMYFDKAARRRLKSYAGPLAGVLAEHLNVYAVVGSDNEIITAAHLISRIHRH
jgi:hypothetical protein